MRRELLKCGEVRTPNDLPRDAGKNQTVFLIPCRYEERVTECGEVRTPNDLPRDAGKNQTVFLIPCRYEERVTEMW